MRYEEILRASLPGNEEDSSLSSAHDVSRFVFITLFHVYVKKLYIAFYDNLFFKKLKVG